MTSLQSPPNRRRRRVVVVVAVLLAMSAVSWWYWPRGDARFVGKWERKDAGTGATWEITLYRNGTGRADTVGDMGSQFSWRVEGDRLILGRNTLISQSGFDHWFVRPFAWVTGRALLTGEMVHEIVHVSPSQLQLKRDGIPIEVIWTRLPE